MSSVRTWTAVLAMASLTLAAPTEITRRSTFRVDQVQHGTTFRAGPIAMKRAYTKFGASCPDTVSSAASAAAAGATGSVVATPEQYDAAYLCPVMVGKNQLNLDFDTGSSDLWVFSNLTPASETDGQSEYDTSSGTELKGETWKITYGDGSGASGKVFADTVVVGGVTATSQAVEAATSVSQQFAQDTDTDGLLGLAFDSINTVQPQKAKTFFDNVKPNLAQALFAADLRHKEAGSYDFGYLDSSKYTGDITYVNVDSSQGFWQFTAGDGIGSAIMDTGTTLLLLPTNLVDNYWKNVQTARFDTSQGGYVFSCSITPPDFHVHIGGRDFAVRGEYLNFAPTDSTNQSCYGGLQSSDGVGINIFGDVFIKGYYVIFDQTQSTPRLGIANKS